MAKFLQIKGGDSTARLSYTPKVRELIVDLTEKKLYIGDGTTPGGVEITAGSDCPIVEDTNGDYVLG